MEVLVLEFTYDAAVQWFDAYFRFFNKYSGPLETVPNMEKFFTADLEFWPFNMPNTEQPLSREQLLMTMVHPGLHEILTPREYVVDLERMVVVVHFQLQFKDDASGRVWPARQASAHYYLVMDDNKNIKIKKIVYFTEAHAPDDHKVLREIWAKYREQALAEQ
jgi:hypothetical protein